MSDKYEGMRWLKCDLHMHTPGDALHWRGPQLNGENEAAIAQLYAEACHKVGLDVVGIVDHNFIGYDFINYLKTAFNDISKKYNHKITLFPGFEFEAAGVGKGIHVLCLFEPDTSLAKIDSILTECGITFPRSNNGQFEKSDMNLKEILNIVQNKNSGIVILPHALSNDGIFDNDSVSEWLQKDQFTNPDLLAVEVPKPVCKMNKAFQKLFRSGEDCIQDWKRIRPIATLMSSDNKNFNEVDKDQKPVANSIGYRYSWLKISNPSIESLRQAFLDNESRIILPDDVSTDHNPSERIKLAKIRYIKIENAAFLADQELYFSPNFNCIIGGRGSGKSTLLEYLRILLRKDNSQNIDSKTSDRIQRVRDTLNNPKAKLEVCWVNADGVEDIIVWQNGNSIVQNRYMEDPDTFFRNLQIQFFSQQQLNHLTELTRVNGNIRQANRLLELIDGFAKDELNELNVQESKLKLQIQENFSKARRIRELEKESRRLKQEKQELERQWIAHREIQLDARRHQLLNIESRYIESLLDTQDKQIHKVSSLAEAVADSHIPFQNKDTPHSDWFIKYDKKVKEVKDEFANDIHLLVESFLQYINNLRLEDPEWLTIYTEISNADNEFNNSCKAKGLSPNDVGHLQEISESLTKKEDEISKVYDEIKVISAEIDNPETLLNQLHAIWKKQFLKRSQAIQNANNLALSSEGHHRFIEVLGKYQQDYQSFYKLWQSFAPNDGRTHLGRNWESCGKNLFSLFIKEGAESPWEVLQTLQTKEGTKTDFDEYASDLLQYIQNNLEKWEKLRCERVQDAVDMKLFRMDGSIAGSISEGSLSDGQRNTAVLALLLAQAGGPIVIDQPEDELDSNFVYRELIPMLRKAKSQRQLIMATHNANLPVNGDAELVVAFEAQSGKGNIRVNGGLDQREVTCAVLDIMEGTEEAFRRRREKYHF